MAYSKYFYNRVNWKNKSESLETPLGKTNLNRMDDGIYQIAENLDVAYTELEAKKVNASSATKMLSEMPTWDSDTGILTFKFYDGTEFSVDFNVEKIPVSFSMDSAGIITMTTEDGTEWTADIGELIPDYTFLDSEQITFTKTKNEDGSYTVTANLVKGSITADYLQPDYLADITKQASGAVASAENAAQSADNAAYDALLAQSYSVGGSGIREGEDTDNAKKYAADAKKSAEEAAAVSSISIATTETAGIVKPDGTTITVDVDGTIHSVMESDDYIKQEEKGVTGGVAVLNEDLAVDKAAADSDGNNIKDTYATKEQLEAGALYYGLLTGDGESLVTSEDEELIVTESLRQDLSDYITQDDIDSTVSPYSVHAVQNRAVAKALEKKVDTSKIANNFTTTAEGFVADARAIKALNDNLSRINDSFSQYKNPLSSASSSFVCKVGIAKMLWLGQVAIQKNTENVLGTLPNPYTPRDRIELNINGNGRNYKLVISASGRVSLKYIDGAVLPDGEAYIGSTIPYV